MKSAGIPLLHQAVLEQPERINQAGQELLQLRNAAVEARQKPLPVQLDAVSVTASLAGSAIARSKSDADGRFAMKISGDSDVVLVAESSRLVGSESELYRWVVQLPSPAIDGRIEVTLANDNLFGTGCDGCIFIP